MDCRKRWTGNSNSPRSFAIEILIIQLDKDNAGSYIFCKTVTNLNYINDKLPGVCKVFAKKISFLSFCVTGREEWKLVAEALGLTSSEIRFLDKRTLNPRPLDAALCFVARQRYITVGYLYDLLNKHGFPVIADFL